MSGGIVIVGAGHGGAQVAAALRQRGYDGQVTLIGDEPCLPYERPPLSKEFLKGEKQSDQFRLRPASFWEEKDIALRTGERVVAVDAGTKQVTLEGGEALGYDQLVWAAGGRARTLSCDGGALAGIHTVRTLADVEALKADLEGRERVLIVGGGYIGLEVAAALRAKGKTVVLLEAMERLLARVAGPPVADFFGALHRREGVDVRCQAALACFEGSERVEAALLDDGGRIACDLAVVGIGIIPEVEPLIEAGAEGDNGVLVDAACRTSLPDIYAIGDCALHRNPFGPDQPIRIESVQNATDMANAVARTIAGEPTDYHALPWFWSNQYDVKLQTVGLNHGFDECLLRGSVEDGSFSALYLKEGRVIAIDCVNAMKDYVQGRKLVESGRIFPAERLADPAVPFKTLLQESE